MNDKINFEIKRAYNAVCKKQDYYDVKKDEYINEEMSLKNKVVTVKFEDKSKSLDELYHKNGYVAKLTRRADVILNDINRQSHKLESEISYLKKLYLSCSFDEGKEIQEELKSVRLQLFNIIQENQQQQQNHSSLYEHLIEKDDCDFVFS